MSDITAIPFEEESAAIKGRVETYWTKRAESFSALKHAEAHSGKASLWIEELTLRLPQRLESPGERNLKGEREATQRGDCTGSPGTYRESTLGESCVDNPGTGLRILDVGCGAGFFEMLLAPLGYEMTGIDLTSEMIIQARELAGRHHAGDAQFLVMDAEQPDFPDETFDAVISRNLTWTLPHPVEAYQQWYRVLKPGGVLLNYDAEYAKGFHTYDQAENCAHSGIADELVEECHAIYHMLSVSSLQRPAWDLEVLRQIGFRDVTADPSAGDRLYKDKDQFYMPDRMFGIRAVK